MNLTQLLAVAGVSIGTAAITSLILQKLSENNIIEVLADCDSKIDRLRNNLDKLSVAKIE